MLYQLLFVVGVLATVSCTNSAMLMIGGIFTSDDTERVFRLTVDQVNSDRQNYSISLSLMVERVAVNSDSLAVTKAACRLIERGARLLLSALPEFLTSHVASVADAKSIPVISSSEYTGGLPTSNINLISMHPDQAPLAQAFTAVVGRLQWRRYVVLYERSSSLPRLQGLLDDGRLNWAAPPLTQSTPTTMSSSLQQPVSLSLHQLPFHGSYRHILRKLRDAGETNFVVDASLLSVQAFLKDAQQVAMVTAKYAYFFTSLDLQMVELEDYRYSGCSITGVRLFEPYGAQLRHIVAQWRRFNVEMSSQRRQMPISAAHITTEAALTHDAVMLLASGMQQMLASWSSVNNTLTQTRSQATSSSLSCDSDSVWSQGETAVNYLKSVRAHGISGSLSVAGSGQRHSFMLDIVQLIEQGLLKVGTCSSSGHVEPLQSVSLTGGSRTSSQSSSRSNVPHVIVTTIMKEPYTMLKSSSKLRAGNDRYEGICVDLVQELSEMCGFNYTLIVNREGMAGKRDLHTGRWSGMIGDLMDKRADLAIADLTITRDREQAINFTSHWMSLGISLLHVKPSKAPPSLFTFMLPFSSTVWTYLGMSVLAVSVIMFFLARFTPYEWLQQSKLKAGQSTNTGTLVNIFSLSNSAWFCFGSLMQQGCDILPKLSPYEWTNADACARHFDVLVNRLSLLDTIWFSVGTIMQQGSDVVPTAVSTRLVAATWWSFTLIMVSSYTANLAASLAVETTVSRLNSAEDLVRPENHDIVFGFFRKGSTSEFFGNSRIPPYNVMWQMVKDSPAAMHDEDIDGVRHVVEAAGGYAYFMESSSLEYHLARQCSLAQVGALLDNKGYGIGVGPGSPISASQLSESIIQLQEEGRLEELKKKWWEKKSDITCPGEKSSHPGALGLKNVGGVFVCLLCGLTMAVVIGVVEFLLNVIKAAQETKRSFCTELRSQLCFVLRITGSVRPVIVKSPDTRFSPSADWLHSDLNDSGIEARSADSLSQDERISHAAETLSISHYPSNTCQY